MSNAHRSEEETTTILMALVAWAGNATKASEYLRAEKDIAIAPATLTSWKVRYGDRYDEMRDKYRDQLESNLANEYRDVARLAVEATREAIEKSREQLAKNQDRDPARSAAALATVAHKATDKLMSLTGRPKEITEHRDASEILRGLISKHPAVFGLTEPLQIEGGVSDGG